MGDEDFFSHYQTDKKERPKISLQTHSWDPLIEPSVLHNLGFMKNKIKINKIK